MELHDNILVQVCPPGGGCGFVEGYGVQLLPDGAIRGGGFFDFGSGACEGSRVAAGIFLAGTGGSSVVRGNGWAPGWSPGVRGGSTFVNWNETDRIPPSVPGIWTVETTGLVVEANRVLTGNLAAAGGLGCLLPAEPPVNVAYRDGLPPAPAAPMGEAPSPGLVLARNSILCDVLTQASGGPPMLTICAATELNEPTETYLENNILANLVGTRNIGLWIRGGGGVDARHNTINPDLEFNGNVDPKTIEKFGVILEDIDAGVLLANNIIYINRDDPGDIPSERLALWERTTGTDSAIDTFVANLIYLQDDALASVTVPPYLRVDDSVGRSEYAADAVNDVTGIGTISSNLVAVPGLNDPGAEKWLLRLADPSSPAVGACESTLSLPVDIDLDSRTTDPGCDIGADEL